MSFADLESAIALSDKGLLSPNSFKNVVRRVVLSRGATAGSAKEVRVCSQMFHRLTPYAQVTTSRAMGGHCCMGGIAWTGAAPQGQAHNCPQIYDDEWMGRRASGKEMWGLMGCQVSDRPTAVLA